MTVISFDMIAVQNKKDNQRETIIIEIAMRAIIIGVVYTLKTNIL